MLNSKRFVKRTSKIPTLNGSLVSLGYFPWMEVLKMHDLTLKALQ